ncbi:hypothetical protein QA597_07825 [Marinilabiliaceae bacterium ANBcel2]|nr:hypothetical protein [Marinilabiliaceae bacterium ANBcel2]
MCFVKLFRSISWVTAIVLLVISIGCSQTKSLFYSDDKKDELISDLNSLIDNCFAAPNKGDVVVDTLIIYEADSVLELNFSQALIHYPIRLNNVDSVTTLLTNRLYKEYPGYKIDFLLKGDSLWDYIPDFYKNIESSASYDGIRVDKAVVKRDGYNFPRGLTNSHIALWGGHGWYYNHDLDRWQWQRARLFGTVEDLFVHSIATKYLIPMLNNAGANVFYPREICANANEVIVDNAISSGNSKIEIVDGEFSWLTHDIGGFMHKERLYSGENPFTKGSHYAIDASFEKPGKIIYIPEIPEDGYYAVYTSWAYNKDALNNVKCRVNYSGGSTSFTLNQQMGYGTWIYLGEFYFKEGNSRDLASVEILGYGEPGGVITTDAVRFGGGMGSVARGKGNNKLTSKRLRYMEGARYFLQYSGVPDTIYSLNDGKNDYNDDYMSRGEWVNYLKGDNDADSIKGLNIPVDISLSLHTDAGITPFDSIIGTLGIYSTYKNDGKFPSGDSRLLSRHLTDIIQTSIVDDIKVKYNSEWVRRPLWDRQYSEAWRPDVPASLIEFFSHQNAADMKYGLDPTFQFDLSRSVYKGVLRFLVGADAVVQPLPVRQMSIMYLEDNRVRVKWKEQIDKLEPTAIADYYTIYMRKEGYGFKKVGLTDEIYYDIELPCEDYIYDFKVTAVNKGGESFAGETLSVYTGGVNKEMVLIVNCFDRVDAPSFFDNGNIGGIAWWEDYGVSDGLDYSRTGFQYDFDRSSPWIHDDSPGWGASSSELEGHGVLGNTFENVNRQGKFFKGADISFISVSKEAFKDFEVDQLKMFSLINFIYGRQKSVIDYKDSNLYRYTLFCDRIKKQIELYASKGGKMLFSGAYIASDAKERGDDETEGFMKDVLGYKWHSGYADRSGRIVCSGCSDFNLPGELYYNNSLTNSEIYGVLNPDSFIESSDYSRVLYRYSQTNSAAAVFYDKHYSVLSFGFPLESVICEKEGVELIKGVLDIFELNF